MEGFLYLEVINGFRVRSWESRARSTPGATEMAMPSVGAARLSFNGVASKGSSWLQVVTRDGSAVAAR